MHPPPPNYRYSTPAQRKALAAGRRVFERPHPGSISELVAIQEDEGETWIFRGDLTNTTSDSEPSLRRLFPNCLISRRG